jgi:hypothetical protein
MHDSLFVCNQIYLQNHGEVAHATSENRVQQSWRRPDVDVGNTGSHLQRHAHNLCTFTRRAPYTYISSKLQLTTETEQTTKALLQVQCVLKQREKRHSMPSEEARQKKPSAAAASSPTPAICGRSCKKMTDEAEGAAICLWCRRLLAPLVSTQEQSGDYLVWQGDEPRSLLKHHRINEKIN